MIVEHPSNGYFLYFVNRIQDNLAAKKSIFSTKWWFGAISSAANF
jgi:hypothetical protein